MHTAQPDMFPGGLPLAEAMEVLTDVRDHVRNALMYDNLFQICAKTPLPVDA